MSLIYPKQLLSGRMIRLLLISPSPHKDQPLECIYMPFNLDNIIPYEALSYVWDVRDVLSKVQILCNAEAITVGSELANALRRLRQPEVTRVVWADAICMNQKDNEEKSYQVPLMGSIYSLATRVVVWLGRYDDPLQVQEATMCASTIAIVCGQYELEHNTHRDDGYGDANLPSELFTPAACDGLKALYNQPWFTRIWCVQEICLTRSSLVLWGDQETDWSDVGSAAAWINDNLDTSDVLT